MSNQENHASTVIKHAFRKHAAIKGTTPGTEKKDKLLSTPAAVLSWQEHAKIYQGTSPQKEFYKKDYTGNDVKWISNQMSRLPTNFIPSIELISQDSVLSKPLSDPSQGENVRTYMEMKLRRLLRSGMNKSDVSKSFNFFNQRLSIVAALSDDARAYLLDQKWYDPTSYEAFLALSYEAFLALKDREISKESMALVSKIDPQYFVDFIKNIRWYDFSDKQNAPVFFEVLIKKMREVYADDEELSSKIFDFFGYYWNDALKKAALPILLENLGRDFVLKKLTKNDQSFFNNVLNSDFIESDEAARGILKDVAFSYFEKKPSPYYERMRALNYVDTDMLFKRILAGDLQFLSLIVDDLSEEQIHQLFENPKITESDNVLLLLKKQPGRLGECFQKALLANKREIVDQMMQIETFKDLITQPEILNAIEASLSNEVLRPMLLNYLSSYLDNAPSSNVVSRIFPWFAMYHQPKFSSERDTTYLNKIRPKFILDKKEFLPKVSDVPEPVKEAYISALSDLIQKLDFEPTLAKFLAKEKEYPFPAVYPSPNIKKPVDCFEYVLLNKPWKDYIEELPWDHIGNSFNLWPIELLCQRATKEKLDGTFSIFEAFFKKTIKKLDEHKKTRSKFFKIYHRTLLPFLLENEQYSGINALMDLRVKEKDPYTPKEQKKFAEISTLWQSQIQQETDDKKKAKAQRKLEKFKAYTRHNS